MKKYEILLGILYFKNRFFVIKSKKRFFVGLILFPMEESQAIKTFQR